jgi:hypothetical protein
MCFKVKNWRSIALIIAAICGVEAVLVTPIFTRSLWPLFKPWLWTKLSCEVVSSSLVPMVSADGSVFADAEGVPLAYRWNLEYAYLDRTNRILGRRFHSADPQPIGEHQSLQSFVGRFPIGSRCACYVNPWDSRQSVLRRSLSVTDCLRRMRLAAKMNTRELHVRSYLAAAIGTAIGLLVLRQLQRGSP